jgi:uroporphyrinogen III methyltransferase / synthase
MEKESRGMCSLVGAGPGDIGLVTLRAKETVQEADIIVYDYLCNPEMLGWARLDAEIIYAGKKAGAHTMRQDEINEFLVTKTREGNRVVRLKGGDPFVFGRGGEEAEALAEAGLKFEVVPGVSSAIAVPAYAGIPMTHRGLASSVTFFTGHEDPDKKSTSIDYQALIQGGGTLTMLMGMERLAGIVSQLLTHGASKNLPVALIRWGTTGRQKTLVSTLGLVVEDAMDFEPPAIAVFGEVVGLRKKLNWFESRPLFGKRIVVTRTRKQAGALSKQLRFLGADVYELPTIRIVPPEDLWEFGELVRDAYQYDWLIFTSPNGVDAFFDMYYKLYSDARSIGNVKIAAIGPTTSQRIKDFRLAVDLQPKEYISESIIKGLQEQGSVENLKFLVANAAGARDILPKKLVELGAIVDRAIAYRTIPEPDDLTGSVARFREEGADLMTFTSSSTVENFLALDLPWPKTLKTASIGPITSDTMRKNGLRVDLEAKQHDMEGLVNSIRNGSGLF